MGRRRADIVAPEGGGGNPSERRIRSAYHRGVEREATEDAIEAVGRRLLAAAERREPIVLTPQWWQERLLAWATGDPEFRVKLLRFVDVLPTLRSGRAVADHVRQYFRGHAPAFVHLGSGLAAQPALPPPASPPRARWGGGSPPGPPASPPATRRPLPCPACALSPTRASPAPSTSWARRRSPRPRRTSTLAATPSSSRRWRGRGPAPPTSSGRECRRSTSR